MDVMIASSTMNCSGGARQALYLAEALAAQGCRVTFFARPHAAIRLMGGCGDVQWAELPAKLGDIHRAVLERADLSAQTIVHAFHNLAVKQFAWLGTYWHFKKLPISCVAHRGVCARPRNPFPYLLPGMKAFIANSAAAAGKLPVLWRAGRVHIVHNSVPAARLLPSRTPQTVREALGIPQDVAVIGTISQDAPAKGNDYLLREYLYIKQHSPVETRLVIVGAVRESWIDLCNELGIADDVVFLSTQLVADYLQIFTVFVFASWFVESQPNVILEAMSMGLPIIASDIGGVAEILDRRRVFPPRKPLALAQATLAMLGDAELRKNAAADNVARSRHFATDNRVRAILDIYSRVAEETAARL